jgi:hypothetical protein
MRNLFDQYKHPENRLTHALMTSLDEDRALLGRFIKWATDKPAPVPTSKLHVLEQSLPNEDESEVEEDEEENDLESEGLPDGCIHDGNGWALLIESKIEASLTSKQLQSHRRSAKNHDLTNVDLLALAVNRSKYSHIADATVKQWTDLYTWLKDQERKSEWAKRLIAYMEVLEAKLPNEGYLKDGTLTVFTGIPFGKDKQYSYSEAKRVLRLAMDELRMRHDLQRELGIDGERPSRAQITGRDSPHVWNFLWLAKAKGTENFRKYPHLGLGIHSEYLHALLIVPNEIRTEFRRNLLDGGVDGFRSLFESVLTRFSRSLGGVDGAFPWVEIVQRRYPARRSVPFVDAKLEFDLRTGFDPSYRWDKCAKKQGEWLDTTYNALYRRRSNLQLAVGAKFPYGVRSCVNDVAVLDHIANAWLACKPLIKRMIP